MLVPTTGLTLLKPWYLFSHQAQKQSHQWSEEGGSFLLHKVLGIVAWNPSWSSDNLLRRQISRTTLGCAHLGNLARTLRSAIFKPQPCLKPLTWDVVVWGGAFECLGFSFSHLHPEGSLIQRAVGTASGICSHSAWFPQWAQRAQSPIAAQWDS